MESVPTFTDLIGNSHASVITLQPADQHKGGNILFRTELPDMWQRKIAGFHQRTVLLWI
jgi:hypothetical protein